MDQVVVGSKNPNKRAAVERAFAAFSKVSWGEFLSHASNSGVSDQPIGYDETLKGADNRAKEAFEQGGLGVGLESGLIPVSGSTTGYMNLTACSIYDGKAWFRGVGPGFELPESVCRLVVEEKLELDDAVHQSGMSDNSRIGYAQGIIGVLSNGAVTREDYMVPAVTMALVAYVSRCGGLDG